MRHVFILNPAAGKTGKALALRPEIEEYFKKHPGEYEIFETTGAGHAGRIAAREQQQGGPLRLYACGGDGTLFEMINGLCGFEGVEVTVIPCGSANDYIRSFADTEGFSDLSRLIGGVPQRVDAIRCGDKVSLNICSMGLDADVALNMKHFKNWPLVSGPMAYDLALLKVLSRKIGKSLTVRLSTDKGEITRQGRYLFVLAANGQFYGGGYRGAPQAVCDDGQMDFVLLKAVSRPKALRLIGGYKRGEHLDWEICETFRGNRMEAVCDKPAAVNMDGECIESAHVVFELMPGAVTFVMPKGLYSQ